MTSKSQLKREAVLQQGFECYCPHCSKLLDTHLYAAGPGDRLAPPREGEYCICSGCLSILHFGPEAKTLHVVTDDDFAALDTTVRAQLAHALVLAAASKHTWGRA